MLSRDKRAIKTEWLQARLPQIARRRRCVLSDNALFALSGRNYGSVLCKKSDIRVVSGTSGQQKRKRKERHPAEGVARSRRQSNIRNAFSRTTSGIGAAVDRPAARALVKKNHDDITAMAGAARPRRDRGIGLSTLSSPIGLRGNCPCRRRNGTIGCVGNCRSDVLGVHVSICRSIGVVDIHFTGPRATKRRGVCRS
ncbi:hypothetical protein EVAR_94248_1 [Eumeta japonica]|uniref:Uncharacterized protein n=1 Tax=Eumeta variegata TaxID=151549 RepID=A0A4C1UPS2_EUMVA|nr:hypothetical protein EVAR_94248_1 [Eumeta japonica]